ncbi:MAG: hypothetical protein EON87_00820 [Brevundimonas sp.]|nr:MAG: hypothetical protein EON87_00820 [Brevundimonas sp.]
MSLGQLTVITAGLLWIATAGVLLEVSRLLGPAFDKVKTVHPVWRRLMWIGALIALCRGLTLIFPGKFVEVSRISIMAPLAGLLVLGLSLAVLDWVMRDRAPPPWSVQVMRLVALFGRDGPVKFAAMAVPPAAYGDAAPSEEPRRHRRGRLAIMLGAMVFIAAMAAFLALNAGGPGR